MSDARRADRALVVEALRASYPVRRGRAWIERETGLSAPRTIEALRALVEQRAVVSSGGSHRLYGMAGWAAEALRPSAVPEPWDLENLRMQLVGHAEQLERDAARARSAADALRP